MTIFRSLSPRVSLALCCKLELALPKTLVVQHGVLWLVNISSLLFQQEYFQYRIEADKKTRWGGIWEAPRDYTFLSTSDKQTEVKLINKFDLWDESGNNLSKRMPRLGLTNDLLLSSASVADDISGTLVYNNYSNDSPIYLKENPFPTVVRYWMREGAR